MTGLLLQLALVSELIGLSKGNRFASSVMASFRDSGHYFGVPLFIAGRWTVTPILQIAEDRVGLS